MPFVNEDQPPAWQTRPQKDAAWDGKVQMGGEGRAKDSGAQEGPVLGKERACRASWEEGQTGLGDTALQSSVVRKVSSGDGRIVPDCHMTLCVCSLLPSACKVNWTRSGSSSDDDLDSARLSDLPTDTQPRPKPSVSLLP